MGRSGQSCLATLAALVACIVALLVPATALGSSPLNAIDMTATAAGGLSDPNVTDLAGSVAASVQAAVPTPAAVTGQVEHALTAASAGGAAGSPAAAPPVPAPASASSASSAGTTPPATDATTMLATAASSTATTTTTLPPPAGGMASAVGAAAAVAGSGAAAVDTHRRVPGSASTTTSDGARGAHVPARHAGGGVVPGREVRRGGTGASRSVTESTPARGSGSSVATPVPVWALPTVTAWAASPPPASAHGTTPSGRGPATAPSRPPAGRAGQRLLRRAPGSVAAPAPAADAPVQPAPAAAGPPSSAAPASGGSGPGAGSFALLTLAGLVIPMLLWGRAAAPAANWRQRVFSLRLERPG